MPRSSRHKSRKHREQSDSDEDVKTKDMNGRDDFSVRISRDSGLSDKRKISSGKDSSGHGNGDTMEEYSGSKRKREKTVSGVATDRWNGGGGGVEGQDSVTMEKEIKGDNSRVDADKSSRSKSSSDLRSKSSRKRETSHDKREETSVIVSEKEESRTGSKVDLKRNSEKDQGRKESKDRDRGLERKIDTKRDGDTRGVVSDVSMKMDLNEERQSKRDKENVDWAVQDEFRNLELEKELEKRMRRRSDSSREKHQTDVKESESRKLSSKSDSVKNGRHKDEKHKDVSYGDKHLEDGDRESRYREEKLHEDPERDRRNKDVKHREDGEREQRYKDSKYHDDVDRESRHRNDKHRDGGHRDSRYEENNLREDGDRDKRKREDKFLEDDNVDNNRYNDKHHESSNGESKGKVDKIRDGRERDDRRRDDKYREDGRQREEKHREDTDKDNRHRDGKQRDDNDRGKRLRDIKYRDEHLRDGSHDKHDAKRVRIEGTAFERHKKSTNQDVSDHNSRDKDDKERRRGTDKDYNDSRSFNSKDQTSEVDKKYVGSARIDTVSDQGKSSSRNADMEISPSRSRRKNSPNSGAAGKSHSRIMQEDVQEERSRNRLSSKKESGGAGGGVENASSISRSIERSNHKDDLHYSELSVEKRPKLDARSSPLQLADKSPSSASVERRHFSRSDVRRSYDIDDSGQRSGGGSKDYPGKESGRGSRDLAMETFPGNDDTFSASSPFTRSNHISGDSRSLLPPPHFRTGSESHSIIGSMEDDNRGKSNNHRNRRVGDSNMGRAQGNAWKGIPNWPSPVANGFMPFQHGPASVGFHPMMQQFHAPPIFGIRPPMDLNHSGVPYHLPDSDRFSAHGRPLGWRNPMDDSTALAWDGNSASVYRDESQMFGRLGWDQNRAIGGMQSWETRQDSWKGQQSGSNAEMPSLPHKGVGIINGHSDDVSIAQSEVRSESDINLQNIKVDGVDVTQSIAVVANEIIMAPKTISKEKEKQSEISKKDDVSHTIIYLSKIGVSVDLTAPDLYDSCMKLKDIEDEPNSDKDDSVILFLQGALKSRKGKYVNNTSKGLPQPTTNEAIFQKALSLYHKQTEGWRTFTNKEEEEEVLQQSKGKDLSNLAGHEEDKSVLPMPDEGLMESSPSILHQNVLPDDVMVDAEEIVADVDKTAVPMDIDKVLPPLNKLNDDVVMVNKEDEVVENGNDGGDTTKADDDHGGVDDPDKFAAEEEEEEGGGGSLILSDDILSKDVVMPDSDDGSELVNLTRIHQSSSESTH